MGWAAKAGVWEEAASEAKVLAPGICTELESDTITDDEL